MALTWSIIYKSYISMCLLISGLPVAQRKEKIMKFGFIVNFFSVTECWVAQ